VREFPDKLSLDPRLAGNVIALDNNYGTSNLTIVECRTNGFEIVGEA
jgi:hypothetical protein